MQSELFFKFYSCLLKIWFENIKSIKKGQYNNNKRINCLLALEENITISKRNPL